MKNYIYILITILVGFLCGVIIVNKESGDDFSNFRCTYLLDFTGRLNDDSINFLGRSTLVIQDDDSAFLLMEGVIEGGGRRFYVDRKYLMSYKKLNKVGLYVFKNNKILKNRQDNAIEDYYHSIFRAKQDTHWEIEDMGEGLYALRGISKTHTLCLER
ncbi:TPA: hypothetical protein ACKQT6_003858 [Serratia marcescens]